MEQAKTIYRKDNKNKNCKKLLPTRRKYNNQQQRNMSSPLSQSSNSNRGGVAGRLGIAAHTGQVIDAFDASIYCLMEQVRNEKTNLDYMNDTVLVR